MIVKLKDGSNIQVDVAMEHLPYGGLSWALMKKRRKSYICASTTKNGKRIALYLHRVVMDAQPDQIVDHMDGDTLNNMRSNLRFVTAEGNARNAVKAENCTSSFKGVSLHKGKYWKASICKSRTYIHLGNFKTAVEAAYFYDLASIEMHGSMGRRNFLPLVR